MPLRAAASRLIAVTITTKSQSAVYVDLVNTFYGRARIPVGMVKGGVTPENSPMIQVLPSAGALMGRSYIRAVRERRRGAEAVALPRRVLAAEKDGVWSWCRSGSARIWRPRCGGDIALVTQKVKLLSVMAGNFVQPKPEFNAAGRRQRAQAVRAVAHRDRRQRIRDWRQAVILGGAHRERFALTADHPVVDAYRNYKKMPYDRPT
jgi:hypothetical protein